MTMSICFSLERYVKICLVCIAVLDQPNQPFKYIYNIKWNEEQFFHLGSVNAFMVDDVGVNP